MWLKGILKEFWIRQKNVTVLCDNQSIIHLIKHQVFHERSKHISVKIHFVRNIVEKRIVSVEKDNIDDNATDMLTKSLPSNKFRYCLELVQLKPGMFTEVWRYVKLGEAIHLRWKIEVIKWSSYSVSFGPLSFKLSQLMKNCSRLWLNRVT